MQAIEIVGVVDAKWRLHNGELHAKFNAGVTPKTKICSAGNLQLTAYIGTRKLLLQIGETRGVQLEGVLTHDAVGAAIQEEGNGDRPDDGDAIFDISGCLYIATRESGGVGENGNREGSEGASRGGVAKADG